MAEIETLREQLRGLAGALASLAVDLERAANAAYNGQFPARRIAADVISILDQAESLARVTARIAKPRTEESEQKSSPDTIDELKQLIAEADAQQRTTTASLAIARICNRIRRLRHNVQAQFPPLLIAIEQANEIEREFPTNLERAAILAEPLGSLLDLLHSTDQAACRILARKAERGFGQREGVDLLIDAAWDKQLTEEARNSDDDTTRLTAEALIAQTDSVNETHESRAIPTTTHASPLPDTSLLRSQLEESHEVVSRAIRSPAPPPASRRRLTALGGIAHLATEIETTDGAVIPLSYPPTPSGPIAILSKASEASPDSSGKAVVVAPSSAGTTTVLAQETTGNVSVPEIAASIETKTIPVRYDPLPNVLSDTEHAVGTAHFPTIEPSLAAPSVLIDTSETNTLSSRSRNTLPMGLGSFDAYRDLWRVGPEGRPEQAPWSMEDYPQRLKTAFVTYLAGNPPPFSRLWLLSAAAEDAGLRLPLSADIEALSALWSGRRAALKQRNVPRSEEINTGYQDAVLDASLRWRFTVFLEAVSPSPEAPLPALGIEDIVTALEFENRDFAIALRELLRIGATAEEPISRVRALLGFEGGNVESLEQQLHRKRRELFEIFQRAQQRRLFRFKTDFCQELWLRFLREISTDIRGLFPPINEGLKDLWEPGRYSEFFAFAERRYAEIMDRGGARLEDRAHMDRWAERLLSEARAVDDLSRQLVVYAGRRIETVAGVPVQTESFRRLLARRDLLEPSDEAFLWRLLVRLLAPTDSPDLMVQRDLLEDPLALSLSDACDIPLLIAYLPALRSDAARTGLAGRCTEVANVRGATACLLDNARWTAPPRGSIEGLLEIVRSPAWRHLLPKLADLLPEAERIEVHQESLARVESARSEAARLQAKLRLLRDAASPLAGPVEDASESAQRLLTEPVNPEDAMLLAAWLSAISREIDRELDVVREELHREARSKGEDAYNATEALITEARFAEAIALLRGGVAPPAPRLRRTPFRFEAASMYGRPVEKLRELASEPAVSRWLGRFIDLKHERAMRSEFCKVVFGRLYEDTERFPDRIVIRTERIRRYLAEGQLNPSYVPQLARIGALILPRIDVPTTDPKYVQRAADVAAEQRATGLAVLLGPRLTRERRDDLLTELRRRQIPAGVVDDLDLCRILNPGGERPNGVLALLELILEQQRWSAMSPFELVEGQHVHIEMYVGRAQEGEELAKTAKYSRLFSGRKLGKSALLRYVERQYDGQKLPSGLELRVLYVSAVGIETARALVDQIVEKLNERFKLRVQDRLAPKAPFERLQSVLDTFFIAHPQQSLLVVLDEADVFVERELEEYQRDYEKCLSFLLRSRFEERRDAQGLPRVRFIFTGYRVTNTREGAWANWGDVLRLVPLPATDAMDLIAGPLARLSIDASEQAPAIAHRCGYQPAVILRFGERLLSRLEQRYQPDTRSRRSVMVTAEDVAFTFEDEVVQQEIRTVAKNNFQGNPVGRVVFGALLGEFLAIGPASRLQHVEEALAHRLSKLAVGQLDWLRPDGGSVHDELRRHVDDLVARQLLEEHRVPGQPSSYYLKFPHHLPVLAQLAREDVMREEIIRLRPADKPNSNARVSRGLLPRAHLSELHELVTSTQPDEPFCPVFGASWAPGGAHDALELVFFRGLFDPLGLGRDDVLHVEDALRRPHETLGSRERIAVAGVHAEHVDAILSARPVGKPMPLLVGGVDLLRDCIRQDHRVYRDGRAAHLYIVGLGRLSRATLSWWFERARGFNFSESNGIDRIYTATSGIPLLVSSVDSLLVRRDPHGAGLEVTPDVLAAVLKELASDHRNLGQSLLKGDASIRLTPREVEILQMLAHVVHCETATSGDVGGDDLALALGEFWTNSYAVRASKDSTLERALPIGSTHLADDHVAVTTLLNTGLVPTNHERASGPPWERIGTISRDDALLSIVNELLA